MSIKCIVIDDKPGEDNYIVPFKFGEAVHISDLPEELAFIFFEYTKKDPKLACIVEEYQTDERFPGCTLAYKRSRFAPVSDIDETCIERNYNLGQVEVFNRILPRFKAKNR